MPAFKVLKEQSINGRHPSPINSQIILSELEAAPFVADKVLEPMDAPVEAAPTPDAPVAEATPSPTVLPTVLPTAEEQP